MVGTNGCVPSALPCSRTLLFLFCVFFFGITRFSCSRESNAGGCLYVFGFSIIIGENGVGLGIEVGFGLQVNAGRDIGCSCMVGGG